MEDIDLKKRLIIYDSVPFFIPFLEKRGFKVFPTLKNVSLFSKIFRRISFRLDIFKYYWFGDWKNFLDVEEVIIFASNEPSPIDLILQRNPQVKLIYWYWNPVYNVKNPKQISSQCEKWSFDKKDCLKYSLNFNTTFFFKDITLPEEEICYDVIFVGLDKGRGAALKVIEKSLLDNGLTPYFYIVDENNQINGNNPPVGYQEYLRLVSKSSAILDFAQEGQEGLTLRPMEALFFKKKLITNDNRIKKEDFYHSNNIFIIGEDDATKIRDFLQLPLAKIPEEVLTRYDVSEWVKRFSESKIQ